MQKSIQIFVLIFYPFILFSQNDSVVLFQNAKTVFQSDDYKRYIELISMYKSNNALNPNFENHFINEKAEFQVMLINSYILTNDNVHAQNEIELFFKNYKNKTSQYYLKVREYELFIEKENIKEEELFNTIQSKKSSYYSREYLKKYPNGKYVKNVTDSLSSYNEFDSWKYCIKEKEISDCQRHLKNHPNGTHSKEITLLLDSLEFDYYNKSINSNYPHVIKDYFRYFPDGKYDSLVREHYKSKLYKNAAMGDSEDIKTYIETFPNDNKTIILDSILQRNYLNEGNANLRKWNFNTASNIYSSYLQKYENGIFKTKVEKRLKRAKLFGSFFNENGIQDYDYTYVMYNYDLEPSHGLTISQLNNNKISFYYNLRFNFIDFDTVTMFSNGTNSSKYDLITPTNEIRRDLIALSIGVKYAPINYPIWVYGAIGYESYNNVQKFNCYKLTNGNRISQGVQFFNLGKTKYLIYPELGVMTSFLKIFMLKYGIMYNGNLVQQFGFGIKINNDALPSLIPESCTNSCMNFLFIGWGN